MADGIPDDSVTLKLKKILTIDGREIAEITIKEPTAGQMAFAEQTSKSDSATEQGIILLGLACSLHPTVIKQLAGSDYVKAQKALGNFFEDDQETGVNA